jgi:APA family basic amino acid/polyamine antiporter
MSQAVKPFSPQTDLTPPRTGGDRGPELKKILSSGDGLAIVVGVVIGAGILGAPGLIAGYLGNPFVMLGVWVFGGVSVALSTLILAELGSMLPRAGGKYAYVRAAYGDRAGCFAGWAEVLLNRSFTGALKANLLGTYVATLVGVGSPKLYVVILVAGLLALHLGGLRAGKTFQNLSTVIKVVVLIAIVAAGFALGNGASWQNVAPFNPKQGAFLAIALAYQSVFFTYYGVETSLQMSEELRDPARSVPRMLLYGAASITGLYLLINLAFLHTLTPSEMAGSKLVAEDVLARGLGSAAGAAVKVAAIAILISSINVNFMGTPRIAFGLGRDQLAPSAFANVSKRGTPTAGLILTALIILTLAVSGTFELLIRFMSFFTLIVDGIVLTSIIALRRRAPDAIRPFRVPAYPLIPALAIALYVAVLIIIIVTQTKLALGALGVLALVAIGAWFGVKAKA